MLLLCYCYVVLFDCFHYQSCVMTMSMSIIGPMALLMTMTRITYSRRRANILILIVINNFYSASSQHTGDEPMVHQTHDAIKPISKIAVAYIRRFIKVQMCSDLWLNRACTPIGTNLQHNRCKACVTVINEP